MQFQSKIKKEREMNKYFQNIHRYITRTRRKKLPEQKE